MNHYAKPYHSTMPLRVVIPRHNFWEKVKKSVWEAWKSLPNVTDAFQFTAHAASISCAGAIFTYFSCWNISHVILYDRTTLITKENELRQELFSKRSNSMESIPPTQVKLAYLCILCHVTVVLKNFFFY